MLATLALLVLGASPTAVGEYECHAAEYHYYALTVRKIAGHEYSVRLRKLWKSGGGEDTRLVGTLSNHLLKINSSSDGDLTSLLFDEGFQHVKSDGKLEASFSRAGPCRLEEVLDDADNLDIATQPFVIAVGILESCARFSDAARQVLGLFVRGLDSGHRFELWLNAVQQDERDWEKVCTGGKTTLTKLWKIRQAADHHLRRLPDRYHEGSGRPLKGDTDEGTWMKRVEQARETLWRSCHLQRLGFATRREFVKAPVDFLEQEELHVILASAVAPLVDLWLKDDGVAPEVARRIVRLMAGIEDERPRNSGPACR